MNLDEAIYLTQKAYQFLREYKFTEAERTILDSISIFEKNKQFNSYYADTLRVYSDILFRQNKLKDAKSIAVKANTVLTKFNNSININIIRVQVFIGVIDIALGEYNEAEQYLNFAIKFLSKSPYVYKTDYIHVISNLFVLYSKKKDYHNSDRLFVEIIESLFAYYSQVFPQFNESERLAFYDNIYVISLTLYNYAIDRFQSNPRILVNLFDFRLFSKDLLTKEFVYGKSVNKTYKDIQRKLQKDEAVVEIVRFYKTDKLLHNRIYYLFIIITSEAIEFPFATYYCCNQQSETKRLEDYNKAIQRKSIDLESFNYLWIGIEGFIQGKSKIYISNDGFYKQINLNSLFTPRGRFLLEEIEIVSVYDFNTFDFENRFCQTSRTATLVGNPAFSSAESKAYPSIKETEAEVASVENTLKNNGWRVKTFINKNATKANIINNLSVDLLHVATHGFYLKKSEKTIEIENVLNESGLLLANSIVEENDKVIYNQDGIITAKDLMHLDISKIKLAVLSACSTGSGLLINSGDLLGFQRALFASKVKAVIVSYFKVPDEQTRELMNYFYAEWSRSEDIIMSFREAQLHIKAKYRHPFYWAGFVLINN